MNPYLLDGPTIYSFSGGRTSGYLLKHVLDAHGGSLPADHHVCFANTGKEHPKTLDFVQECSERWSVPITWLEFDPEAEKGTKIANHNSASRDGEPFFHLIKRKKFIPNPIMRFCTIELKIRRLSMFAQHHLGFSHWNSVIGLRADEPDRIESMSKGNAARKDRWLSVAPLHAAGVTREHVLSWWSEQPFDLRLTVDSDGDTILGNCDLCFMKGRRKIEKIMLADPRLADWWIDMENFTLHGGRVNGPDNAKFRNDRPSYEAMQKHSRWMAGLNPKARQKAIDALENDSRGSCTCHD